MITATTLETFPNCPTYGFTSRPTYRVKTVEREDGSERRDRKWQEPMHVYDGVPLGNRREADMYAIYEFFHAMGGTHDRFRFKDWVEYKSCDIGGTPAPSDQPFITGPGSPGGYQLVKQYIAGTRITQRTIYHPKGDTIRVQNQSGVEQAAGTWTIEEDTGLLFPGGGFSGTPGGWGGEFYVPARFAADIQVEIVNYQIQNVSCTLKELRREDQ